MSRIVSRAQHDPGGVDAMQTYQNFIRGLVKDAAELQAIESGEIDAILDPVSCKAILLPVAQAGLRVSEMRLRSLLMLSSDACWEQDEHYRFLSYTHTTVGSAPLFDEEDIIGKTLWELPFHNINQADWQTYRSGLERRGTIRDLELSYMDRTGEVREISISSAPIFDVQGRCAGYHGVMHDIAERRHARQLPDSGHAVANNLLAALDREHFQRMLVDLEPVTLTYGEVLYEPGQRIRHVYFPVDALVSLLTQVEDNHFLEVGLVGREGIVGAFIALGADVSTNRALVQGTGIAMRMEAGHFREELLQSIPLQRELHQFICTLMAQTEQTAVCNHYHRLEARLCTLVTDDPRSYTVQRFIPDARISGEHAGRAA